VIRHKFNTAARIHFLFGGRAILLGILLLCSASPRAAAQEAKENPEFKMALGLYKDGMFDLASEQFKNFIAAYPSTADGIEARFYLGLTQMKLMNYDEARITFQNFALAYVDHPKAPEAWFNVGEAFLAMGNDAEAASAYERVKVFHPKSALVPEALLKAAEIYRRIGKKESAKQALRSIIQDYPASKSLLRARLAIVDIYADDGQMELAEQEVRRVSEGDAPEGLKASALLALGKLQVREALFEDASTTFGSLLARPNVQPLVRAMTAYELGMLEQNQRHYKNALQYFKQVLSSEDTTRFIKDEAMFESGKCYSATGEYAAALQSFEHPVRTPHWAHGDEASLGAARAAYAMRDLAKTLRIAKSMIHPTYTTLRGKAILLAARASAESRRFTDAAKFYETYEENYAWDPHVPEVLLELANIYYADLGEYRKAGAVLDRIAEKFPQSRHIADVMMKTAECREKLWDYEGALIAYRDLQDRLPGNDRAEAVEERIEFIQNHYIKKRDEGMEKLARVVGEALTDKSKAEIAFGLGEIYLNDFKDYKTAAAQFSTAISGGIQGEALAEASFLRARAIHLFAETDTAVGDEAVASYEDFVRQFPQSKRTEEASYYACRLRNSTAIPAEIISNARKFVKEYPASRYRDTVLFALGAAALASHDTAEALRTLASLLENTSSPKLAGRALVERGIAFAGSNADSAAACWQHAIARPVTDRSTVQALWRLADLSRRRNDTAAVPLFKRISGEFFYTEFADRAAILLTEAELESGDVGDAISHFEALRTGAEISPFSDSTDRSNIFYLANAYDRKGERESAMRFYTEYLQTNRTGVLAGRAFYALGILARLQGRAQAASSYFKEAGSIGGVAAASKDIAELLFQTEQYAEAAKQYEQLARTTDSVAAKERFRAKGIVATLRQDKIQEGDKLIDVFAKEFGDSHPYRAEFEYERGMACYRKQDYQTAGKIFKKVSHEYGETRFGPWGDYYLAKILEVTNKLDDAAKGYLEILKDFPSSDVVPRVQLSLGNMHFNAERYEDAIRYYQKITASPESAGDILPYALNNLIDAYESTKLYDAAMKSAREFIERYPNDESILDKKIKVGSLYTKLGYYDQAILQFQNLIGEAGSLLEAELRYDIGEAYYDKGDYQQAILEFLKVPYLVSRQGKVNWTATSFYMAGQSYEKMSKYDEAIGMYRQILERPGIDATFKGAAKKEIDRVRQLIK
jgi:TolA-binding protein